MTLAATRAGHSTFNNSGQLQTPSFNRSVPQSARPHNLQELAIIARDEVGWDPSLKVTHWLHKAEEFREKALNAERGQDNESMWIELAKSTDILHRLKEHQGYRTYFTEQQRSTMTKVCALTTNIITSTSSHSLCRTSTL